MGDWIAMAAIISGIPGIVAILGAAVCASIRREDRERIARVEVNR